MDKMKFSVVVAVAPDRTPEVIESLKRQEYSAENYEVIVKRGNNTSDNRNSGVKESRGEIIAFVDDDAILEKDWLRKADDFFLRHPEVDVVGGPQLTPADDTLLGHASGDALASILGGASIRNRYRKGELNLNSDERELTSANVFCRKNVFDIAMFDRRFWPGEDPVFFNELVAKGLKLAYCPELYIYHRRRGEMSGLAVQVFRYGYVRPQIRNTGKTETTNFLFLVPSVFLVYLICLPILIRLNKVFSMPLLAYVILVIAVSLILSAKAGRYRQFLLLPAVFFTIHVSYGTGFLCGFVNNLKRNNLLRKIELHFKLLFPYFKNREKNILASIAMGKGLDIGCGSRKISQNCIGIDIIPKGEKGKFGCERNKTSVADYVLSGDNLIIFKNDELDFIVAKHNLEHYSSPEKTLSEWKRVLKKGGRIGVIVPDDNYVNSLDLDPTHKVSFNLNRLEKLFMQCGFKVLKSGIAIKHWSIYLIVEKP